MTKLAKKEGKENLIVESFKRSAGKIAIKRMGLVYKIVDKIEKKIKSRKTELRNEIISRLEKNGIKDEKGNLFINSGNSLLKLEKRTRIDYNVDSILQLLKKNKIDSEEVFEIKYELNKDKLKALIMLGKINPNEIESAEKDVSALKVEIVNKEEELEIDGLLEEQF